LTAQFESVSLCDVAPVPSNAGDLADDPPRLVEASYERLRSERLGHTSTVLGENGNRIVQTPGEVLEHRTSNCVDRSVEVAATAPVPGLDRLGLS